MPNKTLNKRNRICILGVSFTRSSVKITTDMDCTHAHTHTPFIYRYNIYMGVVPIHCAVHELQGLRISQWKRQCMKCILGIIFIIERVWGILVLGPTEADATLVWRILPNRISDKINVMIGTRTQLTVLILQSLQNCWGSCGIGKHWVWSRWSSSSFCVSYFRIGCKPKENTHISVLPIVHFGRIHIFFSVSESEAIRNLPKTK